MNTVYREILAPLALVVSVQFFTSLRQITISQIISLFTQLCLGEFETRWNRLQVWKGDNYTGRKITWYKVLNPIYQMNVSFSLSFPLQ